jgi:hypothetical protein
MPGIKLSAESQFFRSPDSTTGLETEFYQYSGGLNPLSWIVAEAKVELCGYF